MKIPLWLPLLIAAPALAQIPASTSSSGEANYRAKGEAAQPFAVEVIDARRTVSNTLLVRLAVSNNGKVALSPGFDFALPGNAADENSISGTYAVDPNGQGKFGVARTAQDKPLCSLIVPALQPGERRMLFAQLSAPPTTTSNITIVFPKAHAITGIPIGLPAAGETTPASAAIGDPGAAPAPASPLPQGQAAALDQPGVNFRPDVYTNQTGTALPGSRGVAVGQVQSANSDTPFTVEALSVERNGKTAVLHLVLTNNGSGVLEVAGQFSSGISDPTDAQKISGVYLVDPLSKQRFDVVRKTQTEASCSKVESPMKPGERQILDAEFSAIPDSVKSVYVYFPHAAPIADVAVRP